MKHSFLMEPGTWNAKGTFFGAAGEEVEAEGRSMIRHSDTHWHFSGRITLTNEERTTFTNEYVVEPLPVGARSTPWSSVNPHLGKLAGTFTAAGDTLISQYRSEDGRYRGNEHLVQLSADAYHCTGAVYDGEALMSAWNILLRRRL